MAEHLPIIHEALGTIHGGGRGRRQTHRDTEIEMQTGMIMLM